MNQSQIKYARERAESILKARTAAIKAKHTTKAVKLTMEEKLDALSIGSFTIAAECRNSGYYGWAERVKFTAESEEVVEQELIDNETAALTNVYRTLIDELVLGDNEQALKLLKAFEA